MSLSAHLNPLGVKTTHTAACKILSHLQKLVNVLCVWTQYTYPSIPPFGLLLRITLILNFLFTKYMYVYNTMSHTMHSINNYRIILEKLENTDKKEENKPLHNPII